MARGGLQGAAEYKARLRAIKQTFRPYGRKWATATTKRARADAPVRTGKGKRSIRVKTASHIIVPRRANNLVFQAGGRTVFSKKVNKPAMRGLGFANRAAKRALADEPMVAELIKQWNDAA
jgi:hypothetical protein